MELGNQYPLRDDEPMFVDEREWFIDLDLQRLQEEQENEVNNQTSNPSEEIQQLIAERDAWIETARQYANNAEYHRAERMKLLEKYEPEEYARLSKFWDEER
ncbi:MAG: hypothetical protein SF029_26020 [bacterium]|nr:hypothetical protein [bacterium]